MLLTQAAPNVREPRTLLSTGSGSPSAGDFAGNVSIGNRSLYLECHGTGSPTVILEAGYRSPAIVWTEDLVQPNAPRPMVMQGVANFTHVCAYDRPGVVALLSNQSQLFVSRSDPVPQPRTAISVVTDLHTLLHAAGVPGPYVLAAHSLGGLFVRLFASTYPDEVIGMILVDSWYEKLQTLLTPKQWADYVQFNSVVPPQLAPYPHLETLNFSAASATMRHAAMADPLRPMPLAVLAHGQPFGVSASGLGFSPDILEKAWRTAQEELVTLVPKARFTIARESAHYIQLQQPELVTESIRQVVEGVWHNDTWYEMTACCGN